MIHALLQAVLGGTPAPAHPLRATRPQPPWLAPHGWACAAVWIGEWVLEPATEYERDMLDEAARIAKLPDARRDAIDPAPRGSDARLDYAELAKRVVENVDIGLPQYAQEDGRRLANGARRMLAAEDVEPFARALDDELFRIEAAALVAAHAAAARVEQVMYREEGARGRLGACVVRLAGGDYGIVARRKRRYEWFAGSRADVLASLPEPVMSEAVDLIVACEALWHPSTG